MKSDLYHNTGSRLVFRDSIRHPEVWFTALRKAQFDEQTLTYGKYFTECEAIIKGKRYMVYAPTHYDATRRALDSMQIINNTRPPIGAIKFYAEEIAYDTTLASYVNIFTEKIPEGTPLSEAIYTFSQRELLRGLRAFKRMLSDNNISLNNVDIDNIIVGKNYEWHAIRCLYATYAKRKDNNAFKAIKESIEEYGLRDDFNAAELAAAVRREYPGIMLPLCERRRRVVTKDGVGFIDDRDVMVIEVQYRSATDFYENRSVVTTFEGRVGIIDRYGKYIIPPQYDRIEFDHQNGDSEAYVGDEVTIYDYNGEVVER